MKYLKEIQMLVRKLFSQVWIELSLETIKKKDLNRPGAYLLACEERGLEGKSIHVKHVLYVGMSNRSVRTRLKEFINGIENGRTHSAAGRVYKHYCRSRSFSESYPKRRFYFAALTQECEINKEKLKSEGLRIMGHIACLEYYAIAHIEKETYKKPLLNKFGKLNLHAG